jgi:AAA15 family ATPase/GTPase
MLLEFTVGNYLSFKDKKTMSLNASAIKEYAETNLIHTERYTLLKGSVIYGANSSGKSNLIKAMSTMRRLVLQSFKQSSTYELNIKPFLLQAENENKPSFFEIVFLIENVKYRYGFEVDNTSIKAEWLFEAKKKAEKPLFIRENDVIEVKPGFEEGIYLEEKTRDNALFLTVVDQFNGKTAKAIMGWFNNFITISGLSHENYKEITFNLLGKKETNYLLQNFYNNADLGFEKVLLIDKKDEAANIFEDYYQPISKNFKYSSPDEKMDVKTTHKKYNLQNKEVGSVDFDMDSQESSGTKKLFNMSGPIFDVLMNGGVLVVDELDASLHPLLTLAITKLFNSNEHNPKNAQLIFATHDTNLLHYGEYRRDQIYFVEKDQYGASDLYSLVEYKETVRNDRSFEKDYIQGRYGAIPFIGNLQILKRNGTER